VKRFEERNSSPRPAPRALPRQAAPWVLAAAERVDHRAGGVGWRPYQQQTTDKASNRLATLQALCAGRTAPSRQLWGEVCEVAGQGLKVAGPDALGGR